MPQDPTPPTNPQDPPATSSALPINTPPTPDQPKSRKTLAIILIIAIAAILVYQYVKAKDISPQAQQEHTYNLESFSENPKEATSQGAWQPIVVNNYTLKIPSDYQEVQSPENSAALKSFTTAQDPNTIIFEIYNGQHDYTPGECYRRISDISPRNPNLVIEHYGFQTFIPPECQTLDTTKLVRVAKIQRFPEDTDSIILVEKVSLPDTLGYLNTITTNTYHISQVKHLTDNPTPPDWKTYTNQTHGYQYSYPPEWELSTSCNDYADYHTCNRDAPNESSISDPKIKLSKNTPQFRINKLDKSCESMLLDNFMLINVNSHDLYVSSLQYPPTQEDNKTGDSLQLTQFYINNLKGDCLNIESFTENQAQRDIHDIIVSSLRLSLPSSRLSPTPETDLKITDSLLFDIPSGFEITRDGDGWFEIESTQYPGTKFFINTYFEAFCLSDEREGMVTLDGKQFPIDFNRGQNAEEEADQKPMSICDGGINPEMKLVSINNVYDFHYAGREMSYSIFYQYDNTTIPDVVALEYLDQILSSLKFKN